MGSWQAHYIGLHSSDSLHPVKTSYRGEMRKRDAFCFVEHPSPSPLPEAERGRIPVFPPPHPGGVFHPLSASGRGLGGGVVDSAHRKQRTTPFRLTAGNAAPRTCPA